MVLLEIGSPGSDRSDFAFDGKQVRTQHAGRQSWFRSKNGIAIPHQVIHGRQIQGPELLHDIPCGGIKGSQGIWIVITKLFQNMFLVGGVSADVNRFQSVPHILPHMSSDLKKSGGIYKNGVLEAA